MSVTELLARYDELEMAGEAPAPAAYAALHPEHPTLLARLHELGRLRGDLDKLVRGETPKTTRPTVPGFRLLRELGHGGMGVVWAAEQASPRRLCAVKVIDPRLPLARDRFRREADVAARLSHPGIATVYSVGLDADPPHLITEFVHGFSLRALLAVADLVAPDDPSLWLSEALRRVAEGDGTEAPEKSGPVHLMLALGVQMGEALAHAHERGVVHRDVKPSNVMVTFDGRVKIIDFGIAVSLAELDDRVTHEGAFVGSYSYAAPEQLRGESAAVGPWTDTYALGATLFEMLTQRTPFDGASYSDRIAAVSLAPRQGPRAFNPKVPLALDALVMRALHPDPRRRFQDGEEMTVALRRVSEAPHAYALLPAPRLTGVLPQTKTGAWALFATLLAIVMAALYVGERDERRRESDLVASRGIAAERALLAYVLEGARPRLEACIGYEPIGNERPRLVADLTVLLGGVTDVALLAESKHLTAPAARCLSGVLKSIELPGVGLSGPRRLRVDLLVDLEPGGK